MRAAILGLVVFALGLAAAALVSPRAGARAVDGSLSGSVGPGFSIEMSASSVTAGNYTINVTDSSSIHNFHLSGPGVNKSTSIGGTGSTSWSVTLQPGTYSFQCDAHADSMNGTLTVTSADTTTTDTTTAATSTTTTTSTTTPTTTTSHTTTVHTTTQQTTSEETTTESEPETTTQAVTTTAATTTEAETTTESTPTTTHRSAPLKTRVSKTRATTRSVSVSVTSNLHGRALAQLFAGTRRVAQARGTVPGTIVLRPAKPLAPGRYVLKLRVTAAGKTSTSSRVVSVL